MQAAEVSELQASINALRRQNWSQLPDRAPLDLVDPVVVPAANTVVAATLANSNIAAATPPTSALSPAARTPGN